MSSSNSLQQVISFLLGASIATVFLLFILSAKRGGGYLELPSWINMNGTQERSSNYIQQLIPNKIDPPKQEANETIVSPHEEKKSEDPLAELLKKAATKDKTIVITSVNKAWAAPDSLLDLFFESFRHGEGTEHFLKHLIIVTLDADAFGRCESVHPFCYFLKVGGNLAGEKVYMSSDYIDLVWTKVKLQQRILELGYNFLFTDVDIMWFRNPFERFFPSADMSTSCDFFFGEENSPINFPNTGFIHVKSNKKSIEMFKYWHESKDKYPPNHEQWVFNQIKFDVINKMGVKVQFLDPAYNMGFCNNTKDFNKLYTMHANCCVGLGAKLHDLRILLDDWKKYKTLTQEEKNKGPISWRVPGICMH